MSEFFAASLEEDGIITDRWQSNVDKAWICVEENVSEFDGPWDGVETCVHNVLQSWIFRNLQWDAW